MAEETANQTERENGERSDQNVPGEIPELSAADSQDLKILELEKIAAQLKDQLLRKAAEFDNYKKRIETEYANLVRYANEELIEKFLPVLDDFERSFNALKNLKDQPAGDGSGAEIESFIKGIELIYNKFRRILELEGVRPIEVMGERFDPELHDALMMMPSGDHPPDTVLQEVERGYKLHDRVIRHARVIVSVGPQAGDESSKNGLSETD